MPSRFEIEQMRVVADRGQKVFRTVAAQPSWVTRLALYTFIIVIGIPILLLAGLALAAALMVFGVLALANAILVRIRRAIPRDDGRRNVRVIERRRDP